MIGFTCTIVEDYKASMTLIGGMWVIARVTDSKERAQPTSSLAIARALLSALQCVY